MNKPFKSHSFVWSLVLCLGLVSISSAAMAQRVLLDKVIAIVDDDVVLQSEFDSRLAEIRRQAQTSNQPLPPADELQSEIMAALVIENLQMQFAKRVSIRFDDDEINRVLTNMASNNKMTLDEYVAVLEANNVYLQTREQVRKQMTLQELQRGIVNRRITITDQEIENFLNSDMGKEVMAAEFLVDHILVTSNELESAEIKSAKLKYAADLVARIKEGDDFIATREAARSAGIFQIDGTDFGWRKANQLPNIFSSIVEQMTVSGIEGPIQAGNGFHIIRLTNRRGGTQQIVEQTHVRHIMLEPNEIRDAEQSLAAIERLRERIVAGEEFETLARQNSDDATSVVAGGDLDWISQGDMPPEMDAMISQLQPGELSQPFRSDSGWHIAEVLERRVQDLSRDYGRRQAENALRNRKFDLELENWFIEIREKAFVEIIE